MPRFLGLPTRGGRLAILNAFLWLLIVWCWELGYRGNPPDPAGSILDRVSVALSLPLAPGGHFLGVTSRHLHDLILFGFFLVLNSFLWGYGLAYLSYLLIHPSRLRPANLRSYFFPDLTPIDQLRPPPEPKCPTCGYDTRATPTRCPECGTTLQPRSMNLIASYPLYGRGR